MDMNKMYMNIALAEARRAYEENEVPVGAVLVYNEEIIGKAHNQIKTLKDPTAHAEMIAITQGATAMMNERLGGCDLYVTIEPCSMCMGAAVLARIKRVIYGARDPKTGACGSVIDLSVPGLLNHDIEVTGGVLEEESSSMMTAFFEERRNRTSGLRPEKD